MLQLTYIRENKAEVLKGLARRNFDASGLIEQTLEADKRRRATQTQQDNLLSELNKLSKEIGMLFKNGEKEKVTELKSRTSQIKEQAKRLSDTLRQTENDIRELLYQIPNIPEHMVPAGNGENDNVVVFEEGTVPELGKNALPHWELAEKYDLISFELGTKVSGAGFPVYKGKGARLQRALISYFLDRSTAAGYTEYQPPYLVNEASGYGTGQLPDKEGQMYHVGNDDLYLIPTSEVPVTNMFRDTLLKENDFPIKCTSYSPCFRREAGSYGAHVRGLNRLHQFDKVEIVRIEHPDHSHRALEEMTDHVKGLMRELKLPYRILLLCGGDLGFTSAITYDFEVFSTAQSKWLEISSVSNFKSFQANRLKLRFKNNQGKNLLAHTLNGSALALPRVLAGILENYQTDDGIKIPEVLVPYTGFEMID